MRLQKGKKRNGAQERLARQQMDKSAPKTANPLAAHPGEHERAENLGVKNERKAAHQWKGDPFRIGALKGEEVV